MSLNSIQLPDWLVGELYGDKLIAGNAPAARPAAGMETPAAATPKAGPPKAAAEIPATTPSGYKFLGGNQRRVSILVNAPGVTFLPDDQLAVLTKMLEACKMNISEVAIVNYAQMPVSIGPLRQQLQPSIILLFGIQPVDIRLPLNFPAFKVQEYDQCTYLCAPSLEELVPVTEESKLLKTKLWICLKALFNI